METIRKPEYLYHYSTNPHPELLTLNMMGMPVPKQASASYGDTISFFIERPPVNFMSRVFDDHPFWKPGNVVYEHVVDLLSLPVGDWKLVETDFDMIMRDYWNWLPEKLWMFIRNTGKARRGYCGSGKKGLRDAVHTQLGRTELQYLKMPLRPDFDDICEKYAATVPHLVVKPLRSVKPMMINEVCLG